MVIVDDIFKEKKMCGLLLPTYNNLLELETGITGTLAAAANKGVNLEKQHEIAAGKVGSAERSERAPTKFVRTTFGITSVPQSVSTPSCHVLLTH
jgi:hypothetical protein